MKKIVFLVISIACFLMTSNILAEINFGSNIRVDDTGSAQITQSGPAIAVGTDGTIYIVWADRRDGGSYSNIYFSKSEDGGNSFTANIRVNDNDLTNSYEGRLAIAVDDNGGIHVAWGDNRNGNWDIYYAKSTDGGNIFGKNVRVDDTGLSRSYQKSPSMAVDKDGNVYVVWTDERNRLGNFDVYFSKSTDGGVSFGPNIHVDDSGFAQSSQGGCSVALDKNSNIYVVWLDNRDQLSFFKIYFSKSIDGGNSFCPNIRVDDTGLSSITQNSPNIAVDEDGNICVLWSDNREGWYTSNVYFTKSLDAGNSFGANIKVNDAVLHSYASSISVDRSGNVYAAWSHSLTDVPNFGYQHIYLSSSVDTGISFGASVRIDDTGQLISQWDPKIAIDIDGNIYATWQDNRNGNWDIYFAKAILVRPVFAAIEINPRTLNTKSKGNDVVCYIELPEQYNVNDIDVSTVTIEYEASSIATRTESAKIGDENQNGIPDLKVKFDRASLNQVLFPGIVQLTVKGKLFDDHDFEGAAIVRVIN